MRKPPCPLLIGSVPLNRRVSALSNHGQDVGLQTRELRQFAEAHGWTSRGNTSIAGVSGAKELPARTKQVMADAHKRRFGVVCVWRFDRFASFRVPLATGIGDIQGARNRPSFHTQKQMDTSTPAGKMVFTVLGAVAELERSLIESYL